jgi:hypothetical protein
MPQIEVGVLTHLTLGLMGRLIALDVLPPHCGRRGLRSRAGDGSLCARRPASVAQAFR